MAESSATGHEEYADEGQDAYIGGEGEGEGEDQEGYDQKYGEDSEEMKRRVAEMEEELLKISNMQQQVERQISSAADKIDENSIYVGQVDYEATPEELRAHFAPCGTLNRITIVCDKISGHPKGFAYIEFANKESVDNALKLDDTLFKGRQLKVLPKRQNVPMSTGRGRGRGRFGGAIRGGGGRFPGGGRFSPGGRAPGRFGGGRGGAFRGGGSFRGRGGAGYHAAAYY